MSEIFEKTNSAIKKYSDVKLYIATPCYGCMISNSYLVSIMNLQIECVKRGIEVCYDLLGNESLVQRARNILVARFLQTNCTHLLFIDADISFAPESIFKLIDKDEAITSAVYPKKFISWGQLETKIKANDKEPLHMMGLDYNLNITGGSQQVENGFVKVLDTATGFMLIKRHVFEEMINHYPDLKCKNDIQNESLKSLEYYYALFDCMIDPVDLRYLSEDYSFCRRWSLMGGTIYVDVTSGLCHSGSYMYNGDITTRFQVKTIFSAD